MTCLLKRRTIKRIYRIKERRKNIKKRRGKDIISNSKPPASIPEEKRKERLFECLKAILLDNNLPVRQEIRMNIHFETEEVRCRHQHQRHCTRNI